MKNKVKGFFKKLWDKTCEFVNEHPIITAWSVYFGYIGGLLLWVKHAAKKPKYWQRELEFCEQSIKEFTKAKNHALEMIGKLSE